jgi:hypothetical protein
MKAKTECCGWASWGELAGMTSNECPTEWSLETEFPHPARVSTELTGAELPGVTARRPAHTDRSA